MKRNPWKWPGCLILASLAVLRLDAALPEGYTVRKDLVYKEAGAWQGLMAGLLGTDHRFDKDCGPAGDFRIAGIICKSGISLLYQTGADGTASVMDDSAVRETVREFLARVPPGAAARGFPKVEIAHVLEPEGESNVRSSFQLQEGAGLVGTEETGDIYRTADGGLSWEKIFDGGAQWGVADVRNFIRAGDGHIYISTTEPGLVARSTDAGASWEVLARPQASRTVGLVELDNGVILAGLRRSENGKTSIIRSGDRFGSFDWLPLSETAPRQNVTCFGYWGGPLVLAGVGFEGSGKVYKSTDYGKTWTLQAEFPEARDLMGFYRTGDAIHVLASGIATLYISSDNGNTWAEERQFWPKGFLGQCVPYGRNGQSYLLMAATDQSHEIYRHLVLISADDGRTWHEWIDLASEARGFVKNSNETGGGASNICVLSADTIVVGVGNHAVQGRAYSLRVSD